jgi:hypothetical protein
MPSALLLCRRATALLGAGRLGTVRCTAVAAAAYWKVQRWKVQMQQQHKGGKREKVSEIDSTYCEFGI